MSEIDIDPDEELGLEPRPLVGAVEESKGRERGGRKQ